MNEMPEFGIDLSVSGHGMGDCFPQKFAETVAQAMHVHTDCIRSHAKLDGKLSLANRPVVAPDKALESFKMFPQATGAAYAAQIRKQGQVVLCFFGDGASKQGAFAESLNVASLWKLPIVYVMENNSYNVVTRVEQEDANAAAGEPLAMKAKAFSMPGVTVDGADPEAVYAAVGEAVDRARSGAGPTLVESKVYRLSAHGNIIVPPGIPLHFPEHEAIEVFGDVEEYEAAKRGDPVPRFRAKLVQDGVLSAEQADEIMQSARDEMQAAVDFGIESPLPDPEAATNYVYA